MPADFPPVSAAAVFSPIPSAARLPGRRRYPRGQGGIRWLFALLGLALSGLLTPARAQTAPPECSQDEKFANTWYFGYKAGLDFNQATDSIKPVVLTNGQMRAPAGAGVMSDGTGAPLFYSNGDTIWNADGSIMTNGTGLGGNRLTTDGPLPIRMPGSPPPLTPGAATRYLLFTQDAQGGPKGLSYSEIVIPAGGGPGTVVAATKNTLLTQGTTEKMTAVFHKNGCDIWLIVHGWGDAKTGTANRGDAFLAYRVRPATGGASGPPTIDAPIPSVIGSLHAPSVSPMGYRGQMKVTPDGQQLALARYSAVAGDSTSSVELFSFDTETGLVSNPKIIDSTAGGYYGVEFSPGGSRLYATVLGAAPRLPQLLQFDISNLGTGGGLVGREVIPLNQTAPVNLGSLQAAPDGKIYVARENQSALGFIPYPDSLGVAIAYSDDSLQLDGRRSGLGLVNFNQSSLLRVGFGGQSTACLQITFQAPPIEFNNKTYLWTFGDGTTSTLENPVHTFPAPGNYTVTLRITTDCFCREATSLVPVPGAPTPGRIAADQTLCSGSTPAPLTSAAPAGAGIGQYSYQWQRSANNAAWTDIPGATADTYAPGALSTTTYYRRLVTSGFCAPRTPTASVKITVLPALTAGSIAANQTVCAGSPVAPLTSTTAPTGGSGQFAYQWEASVDNVTWTPIAGARASTYNPGPRTVTTSFRRRVTSGPCAALSGPVTITVVPALTAGTIAADQALCAGATPAPLTSAAPAAGGAGTIAYQWESSTNNATWTTIAGATQATYAPGRLTATTYFRRRASAGAACAPAVSNVVTITVAPVLTAGSIAADQTLCFGATPASLTSRAPATGGAGPITYQWESSANSTTWTVLSGATSSTYAPGPLTATTYFRRQASAGGCGPVSSNVVRLTVLPDLRPGTIRADQAICAGTVPAPLTSSAGASGGTGTVTYQWESSTNNATWTVISGATSPTYAPRSLTATTYFRRRVTSGGCGPVPSNVVTITVTPALTAGTIAANQTVCAGTVPAPLTSPTAASGGTGTFTYQWESSTNNATWTTIAGATQATYAPGPLAATTYFRRRVTSGACASGPSNVVTITVTPALTAGTIAASQAVCAGSAVAPLTSATAPTGGTGTYAYQWESSVNNSTWTTIAGATQATYAPGPLPATTYFRRRVTSGPCEPQTSNVVRLTLLPPLTAGSIRADQTICAGTAPAPLTSSAGAGGGTGTFTYQWESSTNNATWTAIAGASAAAYAPVPLTTTTYFRRRVTSGTGTCATGVSNVVVVRVQPLVTPTVTLATPPTQCPGTPLTFTAVVANAGPAPTFQWFVNNAAVASGPTFTSSTLVTGDQVRVAVTPSAGLCSTQPATATVTVTRTASPVPTLTIAGQPAGPVCPGELLTFRLAGVSAPGPAPAYQWQVNGTDVAGATGPVFTSTTLREGQTVTLRLRTTNSCNQVVTAVSNGIAVRIQPPVRISAGPDQLILAGTSVLLEGTADGSYPVTWTPAQGLDFSGGDSLRPRATPLVTTTYTLAAGAGGCAASDQVTVTVLPAIRIPNAFTPNGDGRDDTWQIEFIEQFPDNTVTVFNRWGNKVFSAENYSRATEWRGDINGQPAPVGTYYYVVVTKGPLGRSYSGSLTVLY
ncbi:gliding motility-associated C-terminal domain-containing protein [Hymenobacter sp. NST-14]|uniref:T9SS type B sorting domain-containing protein n=1 Tax=Hymenobacter piscis TaxID=2839984 RepID=UPI001C036C2A|nr:gliding motility-associated C-terminal domain-containing protein [Hymenobacter piscis]MBT9394225.1 gliding motility-associated C-terminal domain-containing protein [Hymenobacter piscis]